MKHYIDANICVTNQNKNTGADATADYVLTADNGDDSTNYGDFGIINSGYDNSTPTNSLGNIVYAADTYLYAQGNVANTSQAGGNLAIGTTTAGKTVKIFAGGNTSSALIANISNTGVSVTGNVTASNFIGNISITGNVTGTSSNVTLVAGSYSSVFDNTGNVTLPNVANTYINGIYPNGNIVLNPQGTGDVYLTPATQLYVQDTTTSTSNVTGAVVVTGGVGISGNINAGNGNTRNQHQLLSSFQVAPTSGAITNVMVDNPSKV